MFIRFIHPIKVKFEHEQIPSRRVAPLQPENKERISLHPTRRRRRRRYLFFPALGQTGVQQIVQGLGFLGNFFPGDRSLGRGSIGGIFLFRCFGR